MTWWSSDWNGVIHVRPLQVAVSQAGRRQKMHAILRDSASSAGKLHQRRLVLQVQRKLEKNEKNENNNVVLLLE